jgi:hypothetical protein
MKTEKLQKWLLLEQSGELSHRKLRRLECELAKSAEARELRNDLGCLKNAVITPAIEPSPWHITRIAARLSQEAGPSLDFSKVLKPALALAAGLAVMTGILNFHGEQTSSPSTAVFLAAAEVDVWNDPLGEDMGKLESLIVAISGDPSDIMEM